LDENPIGLDKIGGGYKLKLFWLDAF